MENFNGIKVIDEFLNPNTFEGEYSMVNYYYHKTFIRNIINQIHNRYKFDVDGVFLLRDLQSRFRFLYTINIGDDNITDKLSNLEHEIYVLIFDYLCSLLKIGVVELDYIDESHDNFKFMVEQLYFFFVEYFNENLEIFFFLYIINNEDSIVKELDSILLKNKDIETTVLKKKMNADIDIKNSSIAILQYLDEVVSHVMDVVENNPFTYLTTLVNYEPDELSYSIIKKYFIVDDDDTENIPKLSISEDELFTEILFTPLSNNTKRKQQFIMNLKNRLLNHYQSMYQPDTIDNIE